MEFKLKICIEHETDRRDRRKFSMVMQDIIERINDPVMGLAPVGSYASPDVNYTWKLKGD